MKKCIAALKQKIDESAEGWGQMAKDFHAKGKPFKKAHKATNEACARAIELSELISVHAEDVLFFEKIERPTTRLREAEDLALKEWSKAINP